jgi:hypothetical protein
MLPPESPPDPVAVVHREHVQAVPTFPASALCQAAQEQRLGTAPVRVEPVVIEPLASLERMGSGVLKHFDDRLNGRSDEGLADLTNRYRL